jgi:hypothetical protein
MATLIEFVCAFGWTAHLGPRSVLWCGPGNKDRGAKETEDSCGRNIGARQNNDITNLTDVPEWEHRRGRAQIFLRVRKNERSAVILRFSHAIAFENS